MRIFTLLIVISSLLFCSHGKLLFPEELVSFLSFVYSILPPFKVGQDSRIGAGFRVGPNADFQVLIELGPQSETQPLGPGTTSARDTRANRWADLSTRQTNLRKRPKGLNKKLATNILGKNVTVSNNQKRNFTETSILNKNSSAANTTDQILTESNL